MTDEIEKEVEKMDIPDREEVLAKEVEKGKMAGVGEDIPGASYAKRMEDGSVIGFFPKQDGSVETAVIEPPTQMSDFESRKQDIQLRKSEMVATSETNFFNPIVYAQMKQMATDFIASKAIPKGIENAEQLIMVFQAGYEMGMKPVEAMNSLYIVNGKITPWGPAVIRRLRHFGWSISYEETPESCKATVSKNHQNSTESYTDTFTFEMAEKSGYTKARDGGVKIGWVVGANRTLKLRYGAISNIVKTYLPEVLGIYAGIAELELDAIPELDNKDKIQEALDRRANQKPLDSAFEAKPVEPTL